MSVVNLPTTLLSGGAWSPLDFDPSIMVWTCAVFLVSVFVLAKFAWKPLLKMLDERETLVRDGMEQAELARAEAKRLSEDFDVKVKEARAEAQRIADEARASAERLAGDIEAKARAEAEKLVERARGEIALAQRQALEEVRTLAVDLAIGAAGAVLKKNVDQEDNRELAASVIKMVKSEGLAS